MAENRTQFDELQEQVQRNHRWTSILIGVFFATLVIMTALAVWQFRVKTSSGELVQDAEEMIEKNYEEIHQSLVETIKEEAPTAMEKISDRTRMAIPDARKQIETFLGKQINRGLEATTELSADEFREFLKSNQKTIQNILAGVYDTPEETEQMVLDLEKSMEAQLGVELENEAKQAVRFLEAVNDRLARLQRRDRPGDPRHDLEQSIVRLLRTIQVRQEEAERQEKQKVARAN